MPAPSLHEIEKTMRTLWMDSKSREHFLNRRSQGQAAQTAAIDNPPQTLLEQIDKKGVELYAGLLNYGYHEVMVSVYPGCRKLLGDKWDVTVDDYLDHYPPSHYNLNRTADRFAQYLSKGPKRWLKKFPFIAELADYEYLELELLEAETPIQKLPHEQLTLPEHFEYYAPVLNPVSVIRKYAFPIPTIVDHLQGNCCLSDIGPAATCVAVFRDPEKNNCRFLEIGELTEKIVEATGQQPRPYKNLLSLAVAESGNNDPQQVVLEFLELVEKLQSVNLFVGSVRIK